MRTPSDHRLPGREKVLRTPPPPSYRYFFPTLSLVLSKYRQDTTVSGPLCLRRTPVEPPKCLIYLLRQSKLDSSHTPDSSSRLQSLTLKPVGTGEEEPSYRRTTVTGGRQVEVRGDPDTDGRRASVKVPDPIPLLQHQWRRRMRVGGTRT